MDELKDVVKEVLNEIEDKYEEELTEEDMEWLDYQDKYESNRWENYF